MAHIRLFYCSFCGKNQDQVQRLLAGPNGVYICDECVTLCYEIITETQTASSTPPDDNRPGQWSATTHRD